MRISDWSSDVCSSDLTEVVGNRVARRDEDQPFMALSARCAGRELIDFARPRSGRTVVRRVLACRRGQREGAPERIRGLYRVDSVTGDRAEQGVRGEPHVKEEHEHIKGGGKRKDERGVR